ncbi:MAG: replication endonuclease [Aliarcobacter sp.]|nr:replication endonuclease [Aliarcobacter sp.]
MITFKKVALVNILKLNKLKKISELNMYGVDFEDKCVIDRKLENQKNFLENFVIDLGDKEFNLLDNTYSANLNPKKYFSEINNRVNSINKYAKDMGLMPVFITLTAPSHFHPIRTINQKKKIIEKNPNYRYDNNYKKAVKDASILLSDLWHKFTSLQVVRKMKKETGNGLMYFRVFEPHESGIPHIHALVYIPKKWILLIKKKFYEYFKKFGIKQLQFKYTWYSSKGGAIAYMMKYITKTFRNAETDIIHDSVYWYIKHRIIRFCSSRSLCSLSVYRKIRYYFKDIQDDYLYINELFINGDICTYFNKTMITYKYFHEDIDDNEVTLYSKRFIPKLSIKKYIVAYLDEKGKKKYYEIMPDDYKRIKLKYIKKDKKVNKDIPLIINNELYTLFEDGTYKKNLIPVSKIENFELIKHFNFIDKNIDNVNLHHYGLVKNEMIKRGCMIGTIENLNLYNMEF